MIISIKGGMGTYITITQIDELVVQQPREYNSITSFYNKLRSPPYYCCVKLLEDSSIPRLYPLIITTCKSYEELFTQLESKSYRRVAKHI